MQRLAQRPALLLPPPELRWPRYIIPVTVAGSLSRCGTGSRRSRRASGTSESESGWHWPGAPPYRSVHHTSSLDPSTVHAEPTCCKGSYACCRTGSTLGLRALVQVTCS